MENTIQQRLAAVQAELKAPKGQYNSFGKYNYRSCEDILEAVKPLLAKNELTLTLQDGLELVGDWHYIKATATVQDASGANLTTTAFAREPEDKKGMDSSQVTGTASSYARKYALNGLFCIDDTKDADTDAYYNQTSGAKSVSKPANSREAKDNAQSAKPSQNVSKPPVCTVCGKAINIVELNGKKYSPETIAANTQKKFGRALCWKCAEKAKANGGNQ